MGTAAAVIREGERLESLQYGELRILQKEQGFHYGTDAVLLADFAAPRSGERMVDLGTGTGVIAILAMSRQENATCQALEIQEDMADMARRSVLLNGMQDRIEVRACDFRSAYRELGNEAFTLAVCNPPYGKAGGTLVSETDARRIARHEDECTLLEVCQAASRLLRCSGRFAVVFPAPRLLELLNTLRDCRLEPKRVRLVHHDVTKAPKLALVEAIKNGGPTLQWMPPLILNREDGTPTGEWRRIYRLPEEE